MMDDLLKNINTDPLVFKTEEVLRDIVIKRIAQSEQYKIVLDLIPETKIFYSIVYPYTELEAIPTPWYSYSIAGNFRDRRKNGTKQEMIESVISNTDLYGHSYNFAEILDADNHARQYFDSIYDLDEESIDAIGKALEEIAEVIMEREIGRCNIFHYSIII
jgi:hypothetical protein